MEKENLKEGTRVVVSKGGWTDFLIGKTGVIKGIAQKMCFIGSVYIVDFNKPISDEYPYSCIVIGENFIDEIENEE